MAQQLMQPGNSLLCISRHANALLAQTAVQADIPLTQWTHDLIDGEALSYRLQDWLLLEGTEAFSSATLINNAGMIPAITPLSSAHPAQLARALRVGLEAPMQITSRFLHATRDWGVPLKVLNISSGLGRRPMASQSAYCAAKAGLDHFTRCLALDEAQREHGARVCALAPGVVDTDMQVELRGATAALFPDQPRFEKLKTQGLLTSSEEAARQVLAYLARADFGSQSVADVREADQ
jgi:NAD(P)-dependent dehydrogenase (short-subunit alcohol dehydrogenase family)